MQIHQKLRPGGQALWLYIYIYITAALEAIQIVLCGKTSQDEALAFNVQKPGLSDPEFHSSDLVEGQLGYRGEFMDCA